LGSVDAASLSAGAGNLRLGQDITTSGAQAYHGPVTLVGNTTLGSTGGGAISFDSGIDGAFALRFNTNGQASVAGDIGGSGALASFDSGNTGSLRLGGDIHANGDITIGNALGLAGDVQLVSGSGAVTLDGTANDTVTG